MESELLGGGEQAFANEGPEPLLEDAEDKARKAEKALLRDYHVHGTSLGHRHWSVSEKTWREWMSDSNKKRVPRRVLDFIEGEARYDRAHLQSPGIHPPGESGTAE
jgi:hypothetical protein